MLITTIVSGTATKQWQPSHKVHSYRYNHYNQLDNNKQYTLWALQAILEQYRYTNTYVCTGAHVRLVTQIARDVTALSLTSSSAMWSSGFDCCSSIKVLMGLTILAGCGLIPVIGEASREQTNNTWRHMCKRVEKRTAPVSKANIGHHWFEVISVGW